MNRETFFNQLRQSGLLSGQVIDEAAARFPDTAHGRAITRALVADGLLTPFQARKLLAGKGRSLHFGPYRILDQLGRGATGSVFKAIHRTMGRIVAIKVVHPGVLEDSAILDLFWREVRAVAQLHHPGIAMAFDAGVAKGRPFLVMEYIDGPSLQRLVQAYGPLPVSLACELMHQAAAALQYAHEQGMVHRDIKPANLLIAYPTGSLNSEPWSAATRPALKIIDFGLARLRRAGMAGAEATVRVEPGTVWGTIDYIAPEQAQDIHAADIRSDLYSLGCTFYYALTGQPPFAGSSDLEKLVKHQLHDPPPLTGLRPDIPVPVTAIIQRLMAKERKGRFQTPAEVTQELVGVCRLPLSLSTVQTSDAPSPDGRALGDSSSALALSPSSQGVQGANESEQKQPFTDPVTRAHDAVEQLLRFPQQAPPLDPGFLEDWRQWTAVIESFVAGRGTTLKLEPQSYRLLHKRLVERCEALAKDANGVRREFMLSLAELVKPWLNPDTLNRTDRELLYSLLWLCHRAELGLIEMTRIRTPVAGETKTEGGQTLLGAVLSIFKKWRE
jgi:serine/threonine protein kinase